MKSVNSMTVSRIPRWMPSHCPEVSVLPAGVWWDAVRVSLAVGTPALDTLGEESGAVIRDGYGGILYWLVPPGDAAGWQLEGVQVLGRGSHVAVPPVHRASGPGLYWAVPLRRDHEFTAAGRLYAALAGRVRVGF
jgi:hypothetical protein